MLKKIRKFLFDSNASLTIISILLGFVVGAIALAFSGYNPFKAYWIILQGIFSRPSYVSYTIIRSTPLILTGLSVAFAFRTGLFNIGAEGQYIIGASTAAIAGYYLNLPAVIHIPVIIILAILAAGLWASLAGYFKSRYGVHEVISTIMLNWIAFYLHNWFTTIPSLAKPNSEATYSIQQSARITFIGEWKVSEAGLAWMNKYPLAKDIFRTPINAGIFIAIIAAIVVWFIMNKSTLGYRLKAVGFNPHAAKYGGINTNRSLVTSMFIAGALAGIAGAVQVMGVTHNISILALMEGYGFDGIAVALIGSNTAFGCVWAALLFGGLKYGGAKIQYKMGAPSEVISIVIGSIIFFIAIPRLIKILLNYFKKDNGDNHA